jgi:hypothetical protein
MTPLIPFDRTAGYLVYQVDRRGPIVIEGRLGQRGVKWEKPPLWPVAGPSLTGFACAAITFISWPRLGVEFDSLYLSDIAPLALSWLLLWPVGLILLNWIPEEVGDVNEVRKGAAAALLAGFLPQLFGVALFFCAFWFLLVIGSWIFISTYQWKYNFPTFRTGFWLGHGAMVGCYVGAFVIGMLMR